MALAVGWPLGEKRGEGKEPQGRVDPRGRILLAIEHETGRIDVVGVVVGSQCPITAANYPSLEIHARFFESADDDGEDSRRIRA